MLLDVLSEPAAELGDPSLNTYITPASDVIGFVGRAIGNVTSHEAGHFFGNWHVDQFNDVANLMDQGGNFPFLYGVGPDDVGGTADDVDVDFGEDTFNPNEGFLGTEDTASRLTMVLVQRSGRPVGRARRQLSVDPSTATAVDRRIAGQGGATATTATARCSSTKTAAGEPGTPPAGWRDRSGRHPAAGRRGPRGPFGFPSIAASARPVRPTRTRTAPPPRWSPTATSPASARPLVSTATSLKARPGDAARGAAPTAASSSDSRNGKPVGPS